MISLLPKLALVICFLVFIFVAVRVLFFYRKEDVKNYSKLPFDEDRK